VPSTINIAGNYQPGGPIVLTASVPGATQLTWNLNGHNPGRVTFPNATGQLGAGQDSIRFRPQSRDLLVTVTGTGPLGTKTFTRELTLAGRRRRQRVDAARKDRMWDGDGVRRPAADDRLHAADRRPR
jgi:hypothetical protein